MMVTAKDLKAISNVGKGNKKAEIFLPMVEKINQAMLERAKEGFFDISYFSCEELHGSKFYEKKDWGCLLVADYHTFMCSYYESLGYKVEINTYGNIKIFWE